MGGEIVNKTYDGKSHVQRNMFRSTVAKQIALLVNEKRSPFSLLCRWSDFRQM